MTQVNEVATLSTDINVITAEINAFIRSGVYNFLEAGRRLKHAKETLIYGSFSMYASDNLCITASQASNLIAVFDQFGELPTSASLGMSKLLEMIALPSEIDRKQFIESEHTIPSTGETKTVDEMTVRELREVKAELKKSQEDNARKDAVIASKERSEEILTRQNERLSDELSSATKPETVVVEKEVERIVEVDKTDYSVADKLRQYEERFGALENYSDRVRGTNLSDVTTSVMTFSKAVRELVKRHAYLLQYQDTVGALDVITRQEYDEAVEALQGFAGLISPRTIKSDKIFDAVIIEQ